jgi:methionyl aminopeptidase
MKLFSEHQLIELHDSAWLDRQRIAGDCVAKALSLAAHLALNNNMSEISLSKEVESFIKSKDCIPTFLGYKGFPSAVCISVNKKLVHGIPTDYIFQEGDVISFDLGATYQGAIADAAITVIKGQAKHSDHVRLVETCKKSLENAISQIAVGKRLGCIGAGINHVVKNSGFGLITEYGGHGLSYNTPHAQPFVHNKSQSNVGVRLQPGMALAIEPMLTLKDTKTRILEDGWTVVTNDIGVHFERSIFIHDNSVEIITPWSL